MVDTNVLVLADEGSAHENPLCGIACVHYLLAAIRSEQVGLDEEGLILQEYHRQARKNIQPGVGHRFLVHLYNQHHNSDRVQRVVITPHPDREFEEFPEDPALASFDRSDRKFVAVALGSNQAHEIANAVDSDWGDHRVALQANGVNLRLLCEGLDSA